MHNGRVLKILIVIGLLLLTGCVNTITHNEEETDAPELRDVGAIIPLSVRVIF